MSEKTEVYDIETGTFRAPKSDEEKQAAAIHEATRSNIRDGKNGPLPTDRSDAEILAAEPGRAVSGPVVTADRTPATVPESTARDDKR